MRTVAITVHNTETLEVFVDKHRHHFEVWLAGPLNGRRTLLDHHLTHDDLEAHLEYASSGDLVWRDAARSGIPAEKHQNAIEMEATIEQGTFWDYDDPQLDEMEAIARQAEGLPALSGSNRSVTRHLDSISFLVTDKEAINAAKKRLLGQWTDGVVTLNIGPEHKLGWSCTDQKHPLNVGQRTHGHAPDWWNFAMWSLGLMNREHQCGTHTGVLRVDEQELHLLSGHPNRMADVFQRIGRSAGVAIGEPEPARPRPRRQSRIAGVVTPMLRNLERAIFKRNPVLAERLKHGLPEPDIRAALSRAKVAGAIEPLVQIYSWRNGTALDPKTPMEETSFFPVDIYQFREIEAAIIQLKAINDAALRLRGMFETTEAHDLFSTFEGQFFPLFDNGAGDVIAVDTTPSEGNRVVAIQFESPEPVRQAYRSFEDFVLDAITANNENTNLSCFRT
jgi:hypothetical protein